MEGTQFCLPKIRMHLNLVDGWHLTGLISEALEVFRQEVRDTYRTDQPGIPHLDHRPPGIDILVEPRQRPVNECDVDVGLVEVSKRANDRGFRFVVAVESARDFRRD